MLKYIGSICLSVQNLINLKNLKNLDLDLKYLDNFDNLEKFQTINF